MRTDRLTVRGQNVWARPPAGARKPSIGRHVSLRGFSAASALFCALFFIWIPDPSSAATPIPKGVWVWDDGRAAIEFHTCGDALCGRIVWLRQESAPNASPFLDAKNPDPSLRNRRICGLDYITGLARTREGDWKDGRIYDFNSGSSYDLDIDSVEPRLVTMRGYKGVRMLGRTLMLIPPKSAVPPCKSANSNNAR